MAQQGATLQNYNNELVKCIEDLREKREEEWRKKMVEVEMLRELIMRRGLPKDTPIYGDFRSRSNHAHTVHRGGSRAHVQFAAGDFAVLAVGLSVGEGGKLGLSLREGERGLPVIGRDGADGLLKAGDEVISACDHENLRLLAYPEVLNLLRSLASRPLPLGSKHFEIRVIRRNCLRLPVASEAVGKVIGTGGANIKMLTAALELPVAVLGAQTAVFPRGCEDEKGIFSKGCELLVPCSYNSTAALEATNLLSSATNGGLFVLYGVDDKWVDHGRLQDIQDKCGTNVFLEWETSVESTAGKLLRILIQPTPGRKPKIRQTKFALKALLCGNVARKERHKRPVQEPRLKAGESLSDMAMDGIHLAPPPSVVKPEATATRASHKHRRHQRGKR